MHKSITRSLLLRCHRCELYALSNGSRRAQSTHALESPVSVEALDGARPFEEIPGPKPLPFLGNMHRYLPAIGEYSKGQWHEAQKLKYKQYGKIVKEQMVPGYTMVHIFDPADLEAVSRHEGKYPKRDFFQGMRKLREGRLDLYSTIGVAAGNGEDWYKMRRKSQKVMMRPQIMKTYLPQMNIIADDFIRRIRKARSPGDHQVPELMNEFYKWALESISYLLFDERMGCLEDNMSADSMGQKYIEALNEFFRSTSTVELSSIPIWRIFPSLSPSFQKLKSVHNFFFENAMEYVRLHMDKLKNAGAEEEEADHYSLMELLLRDCGPRDACVMAIDAMAAGIDTTSLTMAYVLLNLAANPEAQRRLQEEVDLVLPGGRPLTVDTLERMPYLKACIKESMRVTPTVQGTARTLDKDIVLSGYRIPAKTPMTLNYHVPSNEEAHFREAALFRPERWLKSGATGKAATPESFAYQPFGFGPRMCIGRRIADLEMLTLLTKMMQNFWIENHSTELKIKFQLVLMITSPLRYEFHERRQQS